MKNFFQKRERLYGLAAKPERLWFFVFFFPLVGFLTAGLIGVFLFLDAVRTTERTAVLPKIVEEKTESFNKSGFEQVVDFIRIKKEKFEKVKNSSFFPKPGL